MFDSVLVIYVPYAQLVILFYLKFSALSILTYLMHTSLTCKKSDTMSKNSIQNLHVTALISLTHMHFTTKKKYHKCNCS